MFRLALTAGAFALATAAVAADSVVLGHGVSNAFLSAQACPPGSLCMDANYLWVLDADRTLTGPAVKGRVRAIVSQHTDATSKFVKSVELFVLRPIQDPSTRKSTGAEYYLVSLSARDSRGRYCLSVNPSDVGLTLNDSEVAVDGISGYYCFNATVLTSNNRWRGP
jgi:hypothetical protein